MELQTKRLKIIPCTDRSLSTFPKAKGYEVGPHISMYLEQLREDSSLLAWVVWFVIDKKYKTVIGDIGFKGKPNADNVVEVGYGIVPSVQNKGYATEAVMKIIRWAFSNGNINKIIAQCHDDNFPSIKVLEKLHMKRIGSENNMLKWELEK